MMKRLAIGGAGAALLVVVSASPAEAVPVDCTTLSTLQSYIDQNAGGGCFVQDKLFSNFTYTGGGPVTAALVDVDATFNVLPGQDIHGFVFTPLTSVGANGVWTSNFTLGYTMAVIPPSSFLIVAAKEQINTGVGGTNVTAQSTKTPGGVINVAGLVNPPGESVSIALIPPSALLTSFTNVTFGAGGILASLEEDYTQAVIPEPTTLVLLGSGLIGVGTRLRRKRQ